MGHMKQEKNIHSGHRRRLYNMADRVGIENLDKLQQLETMLCFIFPRGDVNPLAHKLLDRFKDINSIVLASVEDLMEIKGIGRNAAVKLRLFAGICGVLNREKLAGKKKVDSLSDVCDYVEALLRFADFEEYHAIGLGHNNAVLSSRKLASGSIEMVDIPMRDISLFVATCRCKKAILVHNHPNGFCSASTTDVKSHEIMIQRFEFSGCELEDNLIVGADGIFSLKYNMMVRRFDEGGASNKKLEMIESSDDIENYIKAINDWTDQL